MIGAGDAVFVFISLLDAGQDTTKGTRKVCHKVHHNMNSRFHSYQVESNGRAVHSVRRLLLPPQFRRIARFQNRLLGAHLCTTAALHSDGARRTELARDALYARPVGRVCVCV